MGENQGYLASNFGVRTVRQSNWETGKKRYVFVDLDGAVAYPVFVTRGGVIQNVGKYGGKVFQGDLCEYTTEGKCYVMKTFELADALTATDTAMYLVRDEFHHIPNVDDILMAAPSKLSSTGTGVKIAAPEATTKTVDSKTINVWKITISANDFGALSKGAILVEAAEAGTGKKMLVSNPNTFVPEDMVFNYSPATGNTDFSGARYSFTPVLHAIAWKNRMSKLPTCVDAINKCKVTGWFEL